MSARQLLEDVFDAIAPLTDPYWNELRLRIAAELDNPSPAPLTDAQIADLWGWEASGNTEMVRNFARAIEQAHHIK
jgi:hypothetical protein